MRNGVIDQVTATGRLDSALAVQMSECVASLRKQNSKNIVWLGEGITSVVPLETQMLERSFRLFRQFGGRIALVGFSPTCLEMINRTAWSRHINVFSTTEDAKLFLNRGAKTEIVPVIEPVIEEEDTQEENADHKSNPVSEADKQPKETREDRAPLSEDQPEEKPLTYEDIFTQTEPTEDPRREES